MLEGDTETCRWRKAMKTPLRSLDFILKHTAYLTYLQSTSCKMLSWMKHKLKSRLLGEISTTSDRQMTPSSDMQMILL